MFASIKAFACALTIRAAAAAAPRSPRSVVRYMELAPFGLAELRLDRGDSGLGAGLFGRLSAFGARDADRADRILSDHDRHAAAKRNDFLQLALAIKVLVRRRLAGEVRARAAEGFRRVGLSARQLEIVRVGAVRAHRKAHLAVAVEDG